MDRELFVPPKCEEHFARAQVFEGDMYVSCCLCGRALDGKIMPVRFCGKSFADLIKTGGVKP